jgi:4-hydroxybenzoate polyprenyltransferase
MCNTEKAVTTQNKLLHTGQIIIATLELMRPKQWTKNLFLFGGIIFSLNLNNMYMVLRVFEGFLIFCLLSSSIYILNDIIDIEKDRQHPDKCRRPLASGRLALLYAILLFVFFLSISFINAYALSWPFFIVSATYALLVALYSFILKNLVILDVIAIALGFVLRALAGTVIIGVDVSPWLLVCTFLLALFIGFNKRRHEILLLEDKASSHRKILDKYSLEMINQMLSVSSSATLMAYCLYTFTSGHSQTLMITIPFVVYGLFRFQYLASQKKMGGSPETMLLKDAPLVLNILLWGIACIFILYRL